MSWTDPRSFSLKMRVTVSIVEILSLVFSRQIWNIHGFRWCLFFTMQIWLLWFFFRFAVGIDHCGIRAASRSILEIRPYFPIFHQSARHINSVLSIALVLRLASRSPVVRKRGREITVDSRRLKDRKVYISVRESTPRESIPIRESGSFGKLSSSWQRLRRGKRIRRG